MLLMEHFKLYFDIEGDERGGGRKSKNKKLKMWK